MVAAMVDQIARAVLYEGYILYPYRPSVKNHQRWTFGCILPRGYSDAHRGSDPWTMQTQCLLSGDGRAKLDVVIRFLHPTLRTVGELECPTTALAGGSEPPFHPVGSLQVGGRTFHSWQEAVEREVAIEPIFLDQLIGRPLRRSFAFPGRREIEYLRDERGVVGLLVREQPPLDGSIEVTAEMVADGLYRVSVRIENLTDVKNARSIARDDAMRRGFASTHIVLHASGGGFVSSIDPPAEHKTQAMTCRNEGCWPVLVGEEGATDTMLAAPIILYDYPKIAPESPGDLFDGTEIDEILSLRIMTLTDEEKRAAADVDERARVVLARTESLAREQLMSLHGTMRDVKLARDPDQCSSSESPERGGRSVQVHGVELHAGDRVILRPRGGADAMDLILRGKSATIAAIERDYENRVHLAVTIDDDPGKDLGADGKPGHRFFFGPDEVEPLVRERSHR